MKKAIFAIIVSIVICSCFNEKRNRSIGTGSPCSDDFTPNDSIGNVKLLKSNLEFDKVDFTKINEDNFRIFQKLLIENGWGEDNERNEYCRVLKHFKYQKLNSKRKRNGFYVNPNSKDSTHLVRLLVYPNYYFEFSDTSENINVIQTPEILKQFKIEENNPIRTGYISQFLLKGEMIAIEIFEQSNSEERIFTKSSIDSLAILINKADKIHREKMESGELPYRKNGHLVFNKEFINILDGEQRGIYWVQASLPTNKKGTTFTRLVMKKNMKVISEEYITKETSKELGWDDDENTYHLYEVEITNPKGNWSTEYEAIFQVWVKDKNNNEIKLAEIERKVYGWQR